MIIIKKTGKIIIFVIIILLAVGFYTWVQTRPLISCENCSGQGVIKTDCDKCDSGELITEVDCEQCNGIGFKQLKCTTCQGTGTITDSYECHDCGGDGKKGIWGFRKSCETCYGDGNITKPKRCYYCDGTGTVRNNCPYCESGKVTDSKDCETCDGKAVLSLNCKNCKGKGTLKKYF
jgi:DnaJ-class molecular chaperone